MLLPASGFKRPCAPGRSWRATNARSRGVVSGDACGNEAHAFVAILAPASGHDAEARPSGPGAERQVFVPPQVQARMRQLQRLGRMPDAQPLP